VEIPVSGSSDVNAALLRTVRTFQGSHMAMSPTWTLREGFTLTTTLVGWEDEVCCLSFCVVYCCGFESGIDVRL